MRPMLNRLTMLCSFALITACSHSPLGDDDHDDGGLPVDSILPSDSLDASQYQDDAAVIPTDAGVIVDAFDGENYDARDGGGTHPDSSISECNSDDDCNEGQACIDGKCVCDDDDNGDHKLGGQGKTEICHSPPGNPDNLHNINVGDPAISAHHRHGD